MQFDLSPDINLFADNSILNIVTTRGDTFQ